MALGRKKSSPDALVVDPVQASTFTGGYQGFTPGDFVDDGAPEKRVRRKKKRGSSAEEPLEEFEFGAPMAADLNGTAPLTQFDFLEDRWTYVKKVTFTRKVSSGVAAAIVLAILALGLLIHVQTALVADETKQTSQKLNKSTALLATGSNIKGHTPEEVIAHLDQRRAGILTALGTEADLTKVVAVIRGKLPPGVKLQTISLTQSAAAAAGSGATPAVTQSVTIVVQGKGFNSVIAWIAATKEMTPTLLNPVTTPSGSPQGDFTITTTATLGPTAGSPRSAALTSQLASDTAPPTGGAAAPTPTPGKTP